MYERNYVALENTKRVECDVYLISAVARLSDGTPRANSAFKHVGRVQRLAINGRWQKVAVVSSWSIDCLKH